MDDAPMIPAVEVTTKVLPPPMLPDEHLRPGQQRRADAVDIYVIVDFERATTATAREAGWAVAPPALNSPRGRPWQLVTGAAWRRIGEEFTVHAPADVKFSLTGSTAHEPTLGSAFWPEIGPAAAGAKLRVEPRAMTVKKPYIIFVRQADGTPVPGVGVRVDGMLPLITDARGEVTAWSAGDTVGRIDVMKGEGWKAAATLRNAKIPASPAAPRLEVTLPPMK